MKLWVCWAGILLIADSSHMGVLTKVCISSRSACAKYNRYEVTKWLSMFVLQPSHKLLFIWNYSKIAHLFAMTVWSLRGCCKTHFFYFSSYLDCLSFVFPSVDLLVDSIWWIHLITSPSVYILTYHELLLHLFHSCWNSYSFTFSHWWFSLCHSDYSSCSHVSPLLNQCFLLLLHPAFSELFSYNSCGHILIDLICSGYLILLKSHKFTIFFAINFTLPLLDTFWHSFMMVYKESAIYWLHMCILFEAVSQF